MTSRTASTQRAVRGTAPATIAHTAHAHAAKFWATQNFAAKWAYGLRGTWSSTR
jgi:hypothetical protein